MSTIAALTTFSAGTVARASEVNANFSAIRDTVNTYGLFTDVNRTITANLTFTPGAGVGITVTSGGITVSAGGVTVSAGGITVTGNSSITGTLTVSSTITSGGTAVVLGAGTSGKIPRLTAASTIGNSAVSDDGTFTTNATQPRCRHRQTSAGFGVSPTPTAIDWSGTSPDLNVGTLWAVGNPTRFTIPANAGGSYTFALTLAPITCNASGATLTVFLRKNGTTDVGARHTFEPLNSAIGSPFAITIDEDAVAGDYYEWMTMKSGGTVSAGAMTSIRKVW